MERENSENLNLNGGHVEIPIGYKFSPTDEELVVHYLRRKVCSLPLPADVIPQFDDVFHSNPWELPGDLKEKRYFFSTRMSNNCYSMSKCSSSSSVNAGCGYWKARRGKDKQIVAPGTNLIIGIKKSWVFYRGRRNLRTQWIMHQFCLVGAINSPCLTQKLMVQVGNWIVCRIYQRNKKARNGPREVARSKSSSTSTNTNNNNNNTCVVVHENNGGGNNNEYSELFPFNQQDSLSSSSSCSSGITDVSSSSDFDQEANSSSSSLSPFSS